MSTGGVVGVSGAWCASAAAVALVSALLIASPQRALAGVTMRGGRGLLVTPFAESIDRGELELGLWAGGFIDKKGAGFVGGPLAVGYGLFDDLELALSMELVAARDPEDRRGIIDPITLSGKYRFVDQRDGLPAIAFHLAAIRGASLDLHPRLVVQRSNGPFTLVGAVGYYLAFTCDPIPGLSTAGCPSDRRAITLSGGAEMMLEQITVAVEVTASLEERRSYRRGSVRFGPTIRAEISDGLEVVLGVQGGIGRRTADARVLLGVTYSTAPQRLTDTDGDQVTDLHDGCPYQAEDLNQWQDEDGCPEGGPPKVEGDAGGVRPFTRERVRFRLRIPMKAIPGEPRPREKLRRGPATRRDAGALPADEPAAATEPPPAPAPTQPGAGEAQP